MAGRRGDDASGHHVAAIVPGAPWSTASPRNLDEASMSSGPKRLEDFLRVDDPDDWELVIRGRQFDPARLLADALDMVELYTWSGNPVAAVSASVEHCGQTFGDRARRAATSSTSTCWGQPLLSPKRWRQPASSDLWRTQRRRMNTPHASGWLVVLSPAGHAPGRL